MDQLFNIAMYAPPEIRTILSNYIAFDDNIEETCDYLVKNDLVIKFENIIKSSSKSNLLKFAVEYGLLGLTKYLYLYERISFDIPNAVLNNNIKIETIIDPTMVLVEGDGANTSLNIRTIDRFTVKRNECYNFLLYVKRYSTYTYKEKQFLYTFNTKYIERFVS